MEKSPEHNSYRVLSIQSHVVYGYVGNKIASFTLQLLGFDVDIINSVHLCNHTGYQNVKGQVLKSEELENIYDGLKSNNLNRQTHILTGYVGNVTFLNKLYEIVQELKHLNPSVYYVCDPVMGDNGKFYVPEEVLPLYRDLLIPISDLITPNQFEAELLSGIKIRTRENVTEVMDYFHGRGVRTVVLSSVRLQGEECMQLFGSSSSNGEKTKVVMDLPTLDGNFVGAGDLFSALLLAWLAKTDGDLRIACEKAANTVHSVLKRTLEYAKKQTDPDSPESMELRIIQSKDNIENPPQNLSCKYIT